MSSPDPVKLAPNDIDACSICGRPISRNTPVTVFRERGQVEGYAHADCYAPDRSPEEEREIINGFLYDEDGPDALDGAPAAPPPPEEWGVEPEWRINARSPDETERQYAARVAETIDSAILSCGGDPATKQVERASLRGSVTGTLKMEVDPVGFGKLLPWIVGGGAGELKAGALLDPEKQLGKTEVRLEGDRLVLQVREIVKAAADVAVEQVRPELNRLVAQALRVALPEMEAEAVHQAVNRAVPAAVQEAVIAAQETTVKAIEDRCRIALDQCGVLLDQVRRMMATYDAELRQIRSRQELEARGGSGD